MNQCQHKNCISEATHKLTYSLHGNELVSTNMCYKCLENLLIQGLGNRKYLKFKIDSIEKL